MAKSVSEMRKESFLNKRVKAIEVDASKTVSELLAQMAQTGFQGKSLARVVDVLESMIEDDDVRGHAIFALGKLKAAQAKPEIERYLDHESAYIRKEAKKAIAKIDKAMARGK